MKRGSTFGVALVVAAATAACGSGGTDAPPGEGTTTASTFLAFGGDFAGFRDWSSYKVTDDPKVSAGIHTSGPRTEYLNHKPAHGSTSFPIGTVIVKEFAGTAAAPGQIFAMVKRGGGFNAAGANGWEWFELTVAKDESIAIVWRGVGPPSGEKYGGDPTGGCNGCHGAASNNDSVQSANLRLSSF